MNKKFLIGALLAVCSFGYASDKNDIIEDRVENSLKVQFKNIPAEYDVDINQNLCNVGVELKGDLKGDLNDFAQKIAEAVKEETQIVETSVSIEKEHTFKDDEVIFHKTFKQN
ncbi:hypothetical protein [uncultured Cetobacterium sp.]|uniref:hypothetical protein n=1 Tax=uncultured Cetobacterium sp. TaxID=527638 RepID=UPI002620B30D|nr:hypothetical protein [uncultured Cetobacterium sp.]